MVALGNANQTRYARARTKEWVAAGDAAGGRRRVASLLRKPPPEVETMAVRELLTAIPLVGPLVAGRILEAAGLTGEERIMTVPQAGGHALTPRQREALALRLEGPGPLYRPDPVLPRGR